MNRFNALVQASIDLRSLASFRIVLGLCLVYNIIVHRLLVVGDLINNLKLIPYDVVDKYYGEPIALFRLFQSDVWTYGYLALVVVLSILFTLGCLKWWWRLLLFFLYGVVNATYPYLSHGPEFLIETSLLWSVLLPVNQFFSIEKNSTFYTFKSPVVLGFYLQLFFIYLSSWLLKDGSVWQNNQVLKVLSYDRIHASDLLVSLQDNTLILEWGAAFGFWLEVLVSIGILVAVWLRPVRIFAFIALIVLHSVMALFLDVGSFLGIGWSFALLFAPSFVWDLFLKPRLCKTTVLQSQLSYLKRIGLSVLLLFILHANLFIWKQSGYGSAVIDQLPGVDWWLRSHYRDPGFASGFYHQPWRFFSGDTPDDLGDFIYVGVDHKGKEYELLSGRVLNEIPSSGYSKNKYQNVKLVFATYLKYYQKRFPKTSLQEWLKLRVKSLDVTTDQYVSFKLYQHHRTYVLETNMPLQDHLVELCEVRDLNDDK